MTIKKQNFIFIFIFTVLICLLCCSHVNADTIKTNEGIEGGYIYFNTGTGSITGCDTSVKTAVIPSSISGIKVTSIGSSAFSGCSSLTSIRIPDSVTRIGSLAFEGCSGLTSITIPNSVTSIWYQAFDGCSGLTSIEIPDSVTSIGSNAFLACNNLKKVKIDSLEKYLYISFEHSSSVPTYYGADLYLNEEKIENLTIPDSVTSIGSCALYGCSGLTSITIPDSVTSIGEDAFYDCSGLTSITIPDSVTSIGSSAFGGCSNLESIILPFIGSNIETPQRLCWLFSLLPSASVVPSTLKNVKITKATSIVSQAFYDCSSLTSIEIPNSVTSIGEYAFKNCSGLTSIEIPNSVTSIGSSAFSHCSGLTSITIPNSVTSIGEYAFVECSGLTSIEIPDSVTSIGEDAFYYCSGLTSITIPDSVTSIGSSAFGGCSNLESIILPFIGSDIETPQKLFWLFNINNNLNLPSKLKSVKLTKAKSIGDETFYNCSSLTNIEIPDSVTSIGSSAFSHCSGLTSITIPNSVTSIGSSAFYYCSGLTNINIPDSVTSIGSSAFYCCSNLESLIIPFIGSDIETPQKLFWLFGSETSYVPSTLKNIKLTKVTSIESSTFYGCSGLTSIEIPDSVTSIESSTFYGCSGLTSIEIPNSVTSIGSSAFSYCSGLTSIEIPDSVTRIGSYAFFECDSLESLTIPFIGINLETPDNLYWLFRTNDVSKSLKKVKITKATSIGSQAFYHCSSLTSIVIPNSVTSIGNEAFYYCSGLTSIEIPNSVTSIGSSAFDGCSGLTSIEIPNSVTSIGSSAFSYCSGLTSITIPDSVTSIGSSAFSHCSGLTSITIPDSVTSIGEYAFYDCSGLTSIEIPNSVTSIGSQAFYYCSGLTSVTIPSSVTSIGNSVFSACSGLTSITIPNSVTSIGPSAFSHCSGLTSVTIPSSVTSIGNYAFSGCSGLTSVTIPDNVTSIGFSAFKDCTRLEYVIISDTLSEYKTDKYYPDNIPKSATLYLSKGSYADTKIFTSSHQYNSGFKKVYFGEAAPVVKQSCLSFTTDNIVVEKLAEGIAIDNFIACSSDINKKEVNIKLSDNSCAVYDSEKRAVGGYNTGTCKITASYGDMTAIATLIVLETSDLAEAESISFTNESITLAKGQDKVLKPTINPNKVLSKPLAWSSSDTNVVAVNNGVITGIATGQATVTVKYNENVTSSINVEVNNPIKDILLADDADTYTLGKGDTKKLIYKLYPSACTDSNSVKFSSSDEKFLTIDNKGLMKGIKPGKATVTITCKDVKKEVTVTVNERPITKITLNHTDLELLNGESSVLSVSFEPNNTTDNTDVEWTSGNNRIASVDESGKVSFVGYGRTTITAKVGTYTATCNVHCRKPITSVSINETGISLKNGESTKLIATLTPTDTTDYVVWASDNTKVATVDNDGVVTCHGEGIAKITVSVEGKSATCNVIGLEVPIEGIAISCDKTDLTCDESIELEANSLPANTTVELKDVTWESSDTTIATIDSNGTLHAITAGKVTITAKKDSLSDSVDITISHNLTHYAAKAATCTEIGWNAYDTCSGCNYTTYAEISKLPHKLIKTEAKAATKTESGNKEYYTCSECGKYFSDVNGQHEISRSDWYIKPTGGTESAISDIYSLAIELNEQSSEQDRIDVLNKIREIGSNNIAASMMAENADETLSNLVEIERKLGTATVQNNSNLKGIIIVGGGLNAAVKNGEIQSVKFVMGSASNEASIKDAVKYDVELDNAVVLSMNLDNVAKDSNGKLYVPVAITFEIPSGIDADKLVVAHNSSSGLEMINPIISADKKSATIIVDHFSDFLVAEQHKHELEHINGKAVTCTTDGNVEYWHCNVCNIDFADSTCKKALEVEEITIPAKGHTLKSGVGYRANTCTASGYSGDTKCTVCGTVTEKGHTTAAHGHVIVKTKKINPTCCKLGYKAHYECKYCHTCYKDKKGKKKTKLSKFKIKKKKHSYTKKIVQPKYLKKAATKKSPAIYKKACKWCGKAGKKTFKYGKKLP